ncbi:MAG: universal stress protein [Desulfobulbaceae bacterium]|nr:universal stress protein [Desulfobulbaceae bacterium]
MSGSTAGDLAKRDTERHILLAVDESDNSRRAVMYVADFFSDYRDVYVHVLSIIQEPSEDFFKTDEERSSWLAEKQASVEGKLAEYNDILLGSGFREDQVSSRVSVRRCTSIGQAILDEQKSLRCCIVVVGRRGISHSEEFVFGSTSNKILHNASHCAVMVVE